MKHWCTVTCSGLKPSVFATSSRPRPRVLGAVPDLEVVAGLVEAGHRVQRLHLGVIAVVAENSAL